MSKFNPSDFFFKFYMRRNKENCMIRTLYKISAKELHNRETKILGISTQIFAASACMQREVWSHNVCISLSIGTRGAILVHLVLHKPQWPAAARLHISSACRSFRMCFIDSSNIHDIYTVIQISYNYILFSQICHPHILSEWYDYFSRSLH